MGKSAAIEVVVYDGRAYVPHKGTIGEDGVIAVASSPPLEFSGAAAVQLWPGRYLLAVDPIALQRETDFHRLRKQVAARWLFENNGDLMESVRNGAGIACLLVAVVCLLVLHGLGQSISDLGATVQQVTRWEQQHSAPQVPAGYELVPVPTPAKAQGGAYGR